MQYFKKSKLMQKSMIKKYQILNKDKISTLKKKPYTRTLELEDRILLLVKRNLPGNAFQRVLKIYNNATSSG